MSGQLREQQCLGLAAAAARTAPIGVGASSASARSRGTRVAGQPAAQRGRRQTPAPDGRVIMSSEQGFVGPLAIVRVC
jgi:hypothetical protein